MSIYPTKGHAYEYAPYGLDVYKTCPHGCTYCYLVTQSEKAVKGKKSFHADAVPIMRNPEKLRSSAMKHVERAEGIPGEVGRVLLSFGSDPYPEYERHAGITRATLETLVECGVPFTTLTKNPDVALRDLDLHKKGNGHFGATVLFLEEQLREKWEPGAPSIASRLAALKKAYEEGVFTWVSLEPVINTEEALALIEAASDFVNMWKVGKINHWVLDRGVDWEKFALDAWDALDRSRRSFVIKRSLAEILPLSKDSHRIVAASFR